MTAPPPSEREMQDGLIRYTELLFPALVPLVRLHVGEDHEWELRDERVCCKTCRVELLPAPVDLTSAQMADAIRRFERTAVQMRQDHERWGIE